MNMITKVVVHITTAVATWCPLWH